MLMLKKEEKLTPNGTQNVAIVKKRVWILWKMGVVFGKSGSDLWEKWVWPEEIVGVAVRNSGCGQTEFFDIKLFLS